MYHAIAISGSLRQASSNTGMLRCARSLMPSGMTLELLDIRQVPLFNPDLHEASRPPAVAEALRRIGEADALVLATPEYNYSIAPALKNMLDWASRAPENRLLSGKPIAIMGAAAGMGSSRAQYHLRQVCVGLNLLPLNKPEVFANVLGGGFDERGLPTDPNIRRLIREQMAALLAWTQRLNGQAVTPRPALAA